MAVTRVTMGADGEAHSQEMPSASQTTSSEDYQQGGVVARTGPAGFATKTSDPDSLSDDAIVNLDGMEVRVGDVKALGLWSRITDAAKAQSHPVNPAQPEQQSAPKQTSETPEYDAVVDALNNAIEEGSISFEEASTYDVAVGSVAMAGITPDQALLTLQQISEGKIAEADIPQEQMQAIRNAEAQIADASTKAAMGELGEAGFAELQQLATAVPGVNDVIVQYAVDRSLGRHGGVTWGELHEYICEQLGH